MNQAWYNRNAKNEALMDEVFMIYKSRRRTRRTRTRTRTRR